MVSDVGDNSRVCVTQVAVCLSLIQTKVRALLRGDNAEICDTLPRWDILRCCDIVTHVITCHLCTVYTVFWLASGLRDTASRHSLCHGQIRYKLLWWVNCRAWTQTQWIFISEWLESAPALCLRIQSNSVDDRRTNHSFVKNSEKKDDKTQDTCSKINLFPYS